jgi:hypothetical protein
MAKMGSNLQTLSSQYGSKNGAASQGNRARYSPSQMMENMENTEAEGRKNRRMRLNQANQVNQAKKGTKKVVVHQDE